MRIIEKYAGNVEKGDLLAGEVNPDAPTRPLQPYANALVVSGKEFSGERGARVTFSYSGFSLKSRRFGISEKLVVIEQ